MLDEQKTALDKQRLQLDAVNVAVASLTRGVTLCLLTLDEAGLSGWEGCWKTRE